MPGLPSSNPLPIIGFFIAPRACTALEMGLSCQQLLKFKNNKQDKATRGHFKRMRTIYLPGERGTVSMSKGWKLSGTSSASFSTTPNW